MEERKFRAPEELLASVMNEGNMKQGKAMKAIFLSNKHLFITGKAGSGKTTFLKRIMPFLGITAVVAPTGIAALNAGGQTIHSFFGFDISPYAPVIKGNKLKNVADPARKDRYGILKRLETLVIDEISMVRPDLLDRIADVLRQARKNNKEPFGGVRLLMFGDLHQLPPVLKSDDVLLDYYDTKYFFSSKALRASGFEVHEFDKVYRQSDPEFLNILNGIRTGDITDDDLISLNSKVSTPKGDYMTICSTNKEAESINLSRLALIPGRPYRSVAIKKGDAPKDAPCEELLEVKIGAQVVITKNGTNYVNGTIGRVTSVEMSDNQSEMLSISVCVGKDDKGIDIIAKLGKETWEKCKYASFPGHIETVVVGQISQFPVRLGYAITTHKSQGMTLDNVLVDMGLAFEGGQIYTALSRVRTFDGLHLKNQIVKSKIFADEVLLGFLSQCSLNNGIFKAVPVCELETNCKKAAFLDFESYGL